MNQMQSVSNPVPRNSGTTRKSTPVASADPSFVATAAQRLPERDVGKYVVRVHNTRMARREGLSSGFLRNTPVVVRNLEDPALWFVAVARGCGPGIEGMTRDTVMIDYDQSEMLGIRTKTNLRISITKASFWDMTKWYWFHPDPGQMVNNRWGITGTVLGAAGLLLAVVGVWLSLIALS